MRLGRSAGFPDGRPLLGPLLSSVPAPAGLKLYVQHWVADAGGPKGFAASNGLQLIGQ